MSTIDGFAIVFTDKPEKYKPLITELFIYTIPDTFPKIIDGIVYRQKMLIELGKSYKFFIILDLDKVDYRMKNTLLNLSLIHI